MSQDAAQFVFMTCRAGAEGALKQEVANAEPTWRPSFSRPGFLTFKNTGEGQVDTRKLAERNWTFAYTHGISLGKVVGDQLADLVQQFWSNPEVLTTFLQFQNGVKRETARRVLDKLDALASG